MAVEAPYLWRSPTSRIDVAVDGGPAADQWRAVSGLAAARLGEPGANLFAQPQRLEDGTLAWVDPMGATSSVAVGELEGAARISAENRVKTLLEGLAASSQGEGAEHARLAAALTIEDPAAIRVAGDRIIIAGWGGVPASALAGAGVEAHRAAVLARYLSPGRLPLLAASGATVVAPVATGARSWRAPAIAAALAGLLLLLLLIPGVLIALPARVVEAPPAAIDGARLDEELRRQIDQLRQRVAAFTCEADRSGATLQVPGGGVAPPAGAGPDAQAPPAGGVTEPGQTSPPGNNPPGTNSQPPPGPQGSATGVTPPADAPASPTNLAGLLKQATVLVIAGEGSGSGVFVSSQEILTNRHVVEGGDGGEIMVAGPSLGGLKRARLVAISNTVEPGTPDFAVLRLEEGRSAVFLSLVDSKPEQLQEVVAAGFPGIILKTDPNFQRLLTGDASALPGVAMTRGSVITVQAHPDSEVVLHSASVSPGNSGGPLVDHCGRVIGVNTFVRASEGANDKLNYALTAATAIRFLRAHQVSPSTASGPCQGAGSVAAAGTPAPGGGTGGSPQGAPAPPPQQATPTGGAPASSAPAPAAGTASTPTAQSCDTKGGEPRPASCGERK